MFQYRIYRLILLTLIIMLPACSPLQPPHPAMSNTSVTFAPIADIQQLTDAEKLGCVCTQENAGWHLSAYAINGTHGYQSLLGEFTDIGQCTAAKSLHQNVCKEELE